MKPYNSKLGNMPRPPTLSDQNLILLGGKLWGTSKFQVSAKWLNAFQDVQLKFALSTVTALADGLYNSVYCVHLALLLALSHLIHCSLIGHLDMRICHT